MKHAISRFFRFFLVAALVAAMAGSLLPSKAFAEAAITATPSTHAVGEAIEWTITLTDIALVMDKDEDNDPASDPSQITLTFNNITVNDVPSTGTAAVTNPGSLITVNGTALAAGATVSGATNDGTLVFNTPVAAAATDTVTIKIKSHYVNDPATTGNEAGPLTQHGANPTALASVDVGVDDTSSATGAAVPASAVGKAFDTTYRAAGAPSELRVGQSAQWELSIAGLTGSTTSTDADHPKDVTANTDKITVAFSAGSVASSIDRNDIIVRSSDTNLADDAVNPDGSSVLTIAPTVSGKTISFFSPVSIDAYDSSNPGSDFASVTVVIAAGIVTAPNFAGAMTATVTVGSNVKAVSLPTNAYQYLSFKPASAPRGATVTVSGGGFAAGTSGSIDLGAKEGVGTYTVDSSGKLSGTFMTTAGTAAGGAVKVKDLGTGTTIESGTRFDQKASATPKSDQVTRGTKLKVTLNDFPTAGAGVTAKIAGEDATITAPSALPAGKTSGTVELDVAQSTKPGTRQVSITSGGETATFLITIAGRVLTVTPSSAVPGQAVRISGEGFQGVGSVDLTLSSASASASVTGGDDITVNQDGTFLYAGKVPFSDETKSGATALPMTWAAVDASDSAGPAAASSGFTIQSRTVTLSPSTANPGATVDISGTGWGTGSEGTTTSQVSIAVTGGGSRGVTAGPFPISSSGEFSGSFTVPGDAGVGPLTVTATDNNSTAGGFTDDAMKTATLTVPTGTMSVNPAMASTGSVITISGSGFPAQTNLSRLEFGVANALPVPAPATDLSGSFTVTINVPAAPGGGSLPPGAVVIQATVGKISGTASFTIPGPSITLSTSSARAGETITVTGTGFSAFTTVGHVNVGEVNQAPTPNPLTDGVGGFTANVVVPALNPGAYTLTVRAGTGFTATAPITVLPATTGRVVSAEIAFQALTSRGILSLAAAAPPGGTSFGAYVPDLAGNTLVNVVPNGVLVLTLNADARISVSGQPAVDVSADTPTFFALGSTVSVEVIE